MNQATNELLAKIKRIKALAQNGVGGEKETAQEMLNRLMKKYGISESDISEELIEKAWFRYKDDCEKQLLLQIFYAVVGEREYWSNKDKRCKSAATECTIAQKLEIEANYEFFKPAIREELEIFYSAFFSKNEIFHPDHTNEDRPMTEKRMKVMAMMEGMDRYSLLKQIGGGNK